MKPEELVVHRWINRHKGRNKKERQIREQKWQEVKHLAKKLGMKLG